MLHCKCFSVYSPAGNSTHKSPLYKCSWCVWHFWQRNRVELHPTQGDCGENGADMQWKRRQERSMSEWSLDTHCFTPSQIPLPNTSLKPNYYLFRQSASDTNFACLQFPKTVYWRDECSFIVDQTYPSFIKEMNPLSKNCLMQLYSGVKLFNDHFKAKPLPLIGENVSLSHILPCQQVSYQENLGHFSLYHMFQLRFSKVVSGLGCLHFWVPSFKIGILTGFDLESACSVHFENQAPSQCFRLVIQTLRHLKTCIISENLVHVTFPIDALNGKLMFSWSHVL